jgi:two-component system, cell cycle sensor histidine kinase DivJ
LGNVGLLEPIRDYVDALVHPSAQADAITRARHRAFMAPRLLGSLAILAAFPLYLVMRGVPSALEVLVFAWLIAPILSAYFLSRTGRYENAHVLSSIALTGLIAVVAAQTGGITSFAAIWLVVVPLEATLSASRRVVAIVSTIAIIACGLLIVVSMVQGPLSASVGSDAGQLAALGVVSAMLYATGLALGAEKQARASVWRLRTEESKYQLLARNMTDVITRHGRNGATLFASPAAESLFGAKPSELSGHGLFDRIHVLDRPAYLTALSETAEFGEDRSVEFRVRRDSAETTRLLFIWVEMRCRLLDRTTRNSAGTGAREVVAVMRDVSERKAQEQALEEARMESDRANAAKGRFLATMSHELRTPLNVIIGFSEMLLNEAQLRLDSDRRREYASLINDSGAHLLAVVNGILDMSRLDNGEFEIRPEPIALVAVMENCCDLLALKARNAGLELSVNVPGDFPEVVVDKRAMKQILINLLSNALKFTDRGGRVVVSAAIEGQTFVITVEDNGIGIGEADLPRLGDPFFQARSTYDRRHDGTGLGLSIVKGLAALHGGDVNIRSRVGEGTRVVVRLPLECEQTLRINVESRPDRRSGSAHGSVGQRSDELNMPVRKSA